MNEPLVSVNISAYNLENYIETAVNSVLAQTYQNFEIILIEDCSTDNTLEVCEKLSLKDSRIKLIHNELNQNRKVINQALALSNGKYIARLDGDDFMYPDRIKKQVEFLESNPDVVVVGSNIEVCDKDLNTTSIRKYPETDAGLRKIIFKASPFCHPSIMFRREIAVKIGGYSELLVSEDYEFYFKIGRFGKFANIQEVLTKLRVHKKSISQRKSRLQEKISLYSRVKAVAEYGYTMTFSDVLFFATQLASMFLIPQKYKFRIYNFLRNKGVIG